MNEQQFEQGWARLLAAFDAKKSTGHMKEFYKNIKFFDAIIWSKVVQNIINNEDIFPKIKTARGYLFELDSKTKQVTPSFTENRKPDPACLILFKGIGDIFSMQVSLEEKRRLLAELPAKAIKQGNVKTVTDAGILNFNDEVCADT